MDLKLENKVAIVTGGSRGLGRAICLGLAAEGANVAINYRRRADKATELAEQIRDEYGAEACPVQGDVAKSNDIARIFDETEAAFGPIDVLVNNAGVWPTAYVMEMTEDQWRSTIDLNLTGAFLMCREAARRWLEANRTGRIVNVSSQAAFQGSTTGHADYAASKAGLVALTVSLAREVAGHGIYVNAIAPGMMRTDMAQSALESREQHYLGRIPLHRIGDPSEIAAVVTFLASERASYMTGATVDVSGGMLMR